MTIPIYSKWAKVDGPSDQGEVHGLSTTQIEQMHERMDKFAGQLTSTSAGATSSRNRDIFTSALPKGASWDPIKRTAQSLSFGQQTNSTRTLVTQQMPYQPEFASPDRQQYPVHRILANRYWRLFYKLDPVIGNCVEMYAELPWSNFELTGDGIEGDIRNTYERMCRETQVLAMLPYFVREYLVVGEAVPHTFFDDNKGIFTHISLHNPDQLEVIDAPFIKMDPIIQFKPDDRLRSVLSSGDPQIAKIRETMPQELLSKLGSGENITLSPLNSTFIPRKLHPYDSRGTSIMSRMWRVLMLEDAIFNASIQTARRNASPLKIAKLGNAATGFIPPPEQEKRLAELLAMAEQDPQAWLIYHYGVQFETVGTNDRSMSIGREWDVIERIKLVALGISKSFLHGEVTYASAATGLQIFLHRLNAIRMLFEQKWLYPKFFKPVAEINEWIKPKPTEITHRYRVKRSARELEEDNAYLIPKIVWDKSLNPQMNTDIINAMVSLEGIGIKFSKTSKMAAIGYSFEDETKKIHREADFEKQFLPAKKKPPKGQGGGGMPSGAPPMSSAGPAPDESAPPGQEGAPPPDMPPEGGIPPTPEGASKKSGDGEKDTKPRKPAHNQQDGSGSWSEDEITGLSNLISDGSTDSPFWSQLGNDREFKLILERGDGNMLWDAIDDYLIAHNYPDSDIHELKTIMEKRGSLMSDGTMNMLRDIEDAIDDRMSEADFIKQVNKIAQKVREEPLDLTNDTFITGV